MNVELDDQTSWRFLGMKLKQYIVKQFLNSGGVALRSPVIHKLLLLMLSKRAIVASIDVEG